MGGTPKTRLRRKSSSKASLGGSKESLPTDPVLNRASTADQEDAKNKGSTPTPGTKRKHGTGVPTGARSSGSVDLEIDLSDSPPEPKTLPPKARATDSKAGKSPLKRPSAAKVKAPVPAKEAKSPKKTPKTKKDEVSKDDKEKKSKAKEKEKEKKDPKTTKTGDKDKEGHKVESDQESEAKAAERSEGVDEKGDNKKTEAKKKIAHKLYMRFWRSLRSQGLNTQSSSFIFVLGVYGMNH